MNSAKQSNDSPQETFAIGDRALEIGPMRERCGQADGPVRDSMARPPTTSTGP
ncbi:hypothetical protein ACFWBF_37025 [Streptomyces sp. NPDC060028]|uniref:hypothetical protein n=1 Tax=Streptomyces sp. NPDC060028 TaxID=3347041 RepID=UPI0036930285